MNALRAERLDRSKVGLEEFLKKRCEMGGEKKKRKDVKGVSLLRMMRM